MTLPNEIIVYVFKENDILGREERLIRAAQLYCQGISCASGEERVGECIDKARFQVEKTPLGKPYFPQARELHFSISHSGEYWVCAFGPGEVGVDIQEHTMTRSETRQEATVRFAKMAHRFFHPVEAEFVTLESFYRFFGVWTARESYVKYTGQGIDASFSEHCVIPDTKEHWPELTPPLPGPAVSWQAQGVWFWETIFEENYTIALSYYMSYKQSENLTYLTKSMYYLGKSLHGIMDMCAAPHSLGIFSGIAQNSDHTYFEKYAERNTGR